MKFLFENLGDPWKLWGVLSPVISILSFFLGFHIQKRLTRYREFVARLHRDLTAIRNTCKQACIDASKLKPALYKEESGSLEPCDELHEIVEYPIVRDKPLLNLLSEFIKHANEQRNLFSRGNGSAHISVDYSSGGQAYYEIWREGKGAKHLPNLSDEQREQLLRTEADQLHKIFESIDQRIDKLLR